MCLVLLVIKGMLYNQTCVVCPRYVSIKPDNRKLANGTNVLGLLIDALLMEGFHLAPEHYPLKTKVNAIGLKG